MSYERGVAVALLLNIFSLTMLIAELNSIRSRNLRKIAMRISWFTLTAQPMKPDDFKPKISRIIGKSLLLVSMSIVSVLLSWLTVLYYALNFAWQLHKKSGAPESLKDFSWKLRNVDLSQEQVILGLAKVSELDPEQIQDLRGQIEERLKAGYLFKNAE
jgi:ABC-type phosphate/phosphonate transport system permease subunit